MMVGSNSVGCRNASIRVGEWGSTLGRCCHNSVGGDQKSHKILMLGLDNVGKTTILYKLKVGRVVGTIGTTGHNVESIQFGSMSLEVWDLGGWANPANPSWIHYLPDTVGLKLKGLQARGFAGLQCNAWGGTR